ncbi:unnamed protein product [Paramecium pentaurelia]|uniref:Transmembrane protein n=1 Tax=Paramecium pentaurelia TaxID=43138 RepID=A0A8S1TRG0_9CILI|nr:unnamed protein product [Paramecium pentaurelia]
MINEELAQQINQQIQLKKKQPCELEILRKQKIQNFVANNLVCKIIILELQEVILNINNFRKQEQFFLFLFQKLDLQFQQITIKELFQFFMSINKKMILILYNISKKCLVYDDFIQSNKYKILLRGQIKKLQNFKYCHQLHILMKIIWKNSQQFFLIIYLYLIVKKIELAWMYQKQLAISYLLQYKF